MRDKVRALDRAMPANNDAKLGALLEELIQKHNSLLAKLDADAGVTDTNYTALLTITPLSQR